MSYLPYGRQDITDADIASVNRVLRSDRITQGPTIVQFEEAIAGYCGASHAVAVNSATSALHIACLALDMGEGDLVWTSPNTFVATANCARFCGANVDFVDIDCQTYNVCPQALAAKLQRVKERGEQLPDVVIVVHFGGQSCDMKAIARLADEYGFRIIEDASHAIGGAYHDEPIGSCRYSDITVFSFHPVKIITSAEGGVAVTNCAALSERMSALRTHGVYRLCHDNQGQEVEPWIYEQRELGFNYRITDIQAALGLSQLDRLDHYVQRRHELASRYTRYLQSDNIILPVQSIDCYSSWHLYPIQIVNSITGYSDRLSVYHYMTERDIGVNVHYIPVHTQPYYQALGHRRGDYPNAENYYSAALSLPIFGSMTDCEQDRVIDCLLSSLLINKLAA